MTLVYIVIGPDGIPAEFTADPARAEWWSAPERTELFTVHQIEMQPFQAEGSAD